MKPKERRKPYSTAIILGVVIAGFLTLVVSNYLPDMHWGIYTVIFLALMAGVTNGYIELKANERIIDRD